MIFVFKTNFIFSNRLLSSCWAFSAIGAIESAHHKAKNESAVLSEQQKVDCDHQDLGCKRGLPSLAYHYIKKNGGVNKDECYKMFESFLFLLNMNIGILKGARI